MAGGGGGGGSQLDRGGDRWRGRGQGDNWTEEWGKTGQRRDSWTGRR